MARNLLKFGLLFIGVAAVLIGLMFVGLGAAKTGAIFNTVLSLVYSGGHDGGVMSGLTNPNADSELRFYSVIFIGYGIVLVQTAQNLTRHMSRVPFLLLLFFGGGIARLISLLSVGTPHASFLVLLVIELALPALLGLCYIKVARNKKPASPT